MDVRNVNKNIATLDQPNRLSEKITTQKALKSDSTADRDGNGQMPYQEPNKKPKPAMTMEVCEKAARMIAALDHIQKAGLIVEAVERNQKFFIDIRDSEGQVIRTLSEADIWLVFEGSDSATGKIFHKVA